MSDLSSLIVDLETELLEKDDVNGVFVLVCRDDVLKNKTLKWAKDDTSLFNLENIAEKVLKPHHIKRLETAIQKVEGLVNGGLK